MTNLSDLFPVASAYTPAMMEFDGSTGYYTKTGINSIGAGNKVTTVIRFKIPSFTGGGLNYMFYHLPQYGRVEIVCWSSDYADADYADRVSVITRNSANTIVAFLQSPIGLLDDLPHTLFYTFDGDAGTAEYIIDGVDADDTGNANRVAPTTATLSTNASGSLSVGATNGGASLTAGELGFAGIIDAGGLNWEDFMNIYGEPKQLDEAGWTEWGAQPLLWNEHGEMSNNFGSAGDMTKNGTIVVGKGGN